MVAGRLSLRGNAMIDKFYYEPCFVCGEMVGEDNDPEAFEGDEVICEYCRENKELPFDDPVEELAEHRKCLDIERARAAGVD